MSEKYKFTGDEINQVLLHSPYALSSSPAEGGMSGEQIKRFFYDFIRVFADKLNGHLGEIGAGIDKTVSDLTELLGEKLREHNQEEGSHKDVREALSRLTNGVDNACNTALSAYNKANDAYSLATGKTKVHVVPSFSMMITELINMGAFAGDIFLIFDKKTPDFIVIGNGVAPGAISITRDDMGALPSPEVGAIYCVEGISVAAIESGIDTDALATKEELNGLINSFSGVLDNLHEYAQALVTNGKEVA